MECDDLFPGGVGGWIGNGLTPRDETPLATFDDPKAPFRKAAEAQAQKKDTQAEKG